MAFRWRVDDGPALNAGLVALRFFRGSRPILLENPIFLKFFRGGGQNSLSTPPPLDPHMDADSMETVDYDWSDYMNVDAVVDTF